MEGEQSQSRSKRQADPVVNSANKRLSVDRGQSFTGNMNTRANFATCSPVADIEFDSSSSMPAMVNAVHQSSSYELQSAGRNAPSRNISEHGDVQINDLPLTQNSLESPNGSPNGPPTGYSSCRRSLSGYDQNCSTDNANLLHANMACHEETHMG